MTQIDHSLAPQLSGLSQVTEPPMAHARARIAVVASLTSSLIGFRYELLRELALRADVLALAPDHDPRAETALARIGVRFQRIPMARTGKNPFQDILTLVALLHAFRTFRPDIVLPYTMKPIIYAGLAGRIVGVRKRVAMCTGLGYLFVQDGRQTLIKRALRRLSMSLYRAALRGSTTLSSTTPPMPTNSGAIGLYRTRPVSVLCRGPA